MNETEHLLTCLAEESGETSVELIEAAGVCQRIAKEAHKALRFGLDDKLTMDPAGPRGTEGPNNKEKILGELNDLLGVVGILVDRGIFPADWQDKEAQERKKAKVLAYMGYSERIGALQREK